MTPRALAAALFTGATVITGVATAEAAETTIQPGDVLDIQVFGEQALSQKVTVARDGSITFPLVGRLIVAGKSTNQASDAIASGLTKYVRHPIVAVGIATEAQYNVLVLGNVKTPGRYTVPPGSLVTDAIAAAGGLGPTNGKYPDARVVVGDMVKSVPLEALLRRGDLAANVPLANNAAVYVPSPATIKVQVMGAVDHPGDIEINQGDHLAVAVAKAGNSANANADLNHIVLTRRSASGQQRSEYNLYKALHDGDAASDPALAPDDIVYIPEGKRRGNYDAGGILGVLRRLVLPF